MAGKVFINYRRRLSENEAELLFEKLKRPLGAHRLFFDKDGLDGKSNWVHELERQVAGSAVMLAVIPKGWAEFEGKQKGQRALDDPSDFVRFEISHALQRRIPVYPIPVDGAELPDLDHLPKALWGLTLGQSKPFRRESRDEDAAAIARIVAAELREHRRARPSMVALAGAVAASLALGVLAGPWLLSTAGLPMPFVDVVGVGALRSVEASRLAAEQRARTAQAALDTAVTARSKAEADLAAARTKAEADMKAAEARGSGSAEAVQRATSARDAALKEGREARERAETAEKDLVAARAAVAAAEKKAAGIAAELEAKRNTPSPIPEIISSAPDENFAFGRRADRRLADPLAMLAPGSGQSARDCSDCPEMVVLPAGSFTMGSTDGESDEKPPRTVSIRRPFAVGKFEVTFAEWETCVAGNGCTTNKSPSDRRWGKELSLNFSRL